MKKFFSQFEKIGLKKKPKPSPFPVRKTSKPKSRPSWLHPEVVRRRQLKGEHTKLLHLILADLAEIKESLGKRG